jgi:acetyltransferase-like isoleucine patch superfamily enzyme
VFCFSLHKKILKLIAKDLPGWRIRVFLFKVAGYIIGKNTYIGEGLLIIDEPVDKGMIIIGNNVAIAPRVTLVASSYANYSEIRNLVGEKHSPVTIDDHSWIGTGAIILPGVTIAKYSIVAAGAVVTKSFPEFSILGGVPARLIGRVPQNGEIYEEKTTSQ